MLPIRGARSALPSLPRRSIEARSPGQAASAANVLGAGWKSPPAVMASDRLSPRALAGAIRRGQQSRCDSDADGHSPDEREREDFGGSVPRPVDFSPYALILVLTKRSHHESELSRDPSHKREPGRGRSHRLRAVVLAQ